VKDVRVVTFNCAAGNKRITTRQADLLQLPFYRDVLEGTEDAPLLCLQEVGPEQSRALRAAVADGAPCELLQLRRPGLGNALLVPHRYAVVRRRRNYYLYAQARGVADALERRRRAREHADMRQFGEARMWLQACLLDRESGRRFTILTTHVSVDPALKVAQVRAIVRRTLRAAWDGPVILAGDLNVPADDARGRDREAADDLRRLRDMDVSGPGAHRARPNIDYVLALGFEPVSTRIWTGDSLALPGSLDAEHVSDHYAEDDLLRYAETG
jgi:endonuclease/exonuclease/phosphatase family metal-dependent hydrolase